MDIKIKLSFKDPDVCSEIIEQQSKNKQSKFDKTYFEFGEYGVIEIDPISLECKLIPKKDW